MNFNTNYIFRNETNENLRDKKLFSKGKQMQKVGVGAEVLDK